MHIRLKMYWNAQKDAFYITIFEMHAVNQQMVLKCMNVELKLTKN